MAKGIPVIGRDPSGQAKIVNVDKDGNLKVQVSGTFVRLSTEPKPSGSEGDSLLLYDTKQVFIHDGADWREW